ncbi:hypothetical protein B0H14DRAFT_2588452 [Mycena olivaceomarginata]|nr:hypothetical protein B0H14DRAFT_2588452 [Mycena olivaceomarginata]
MDDNRHDVVPKDIASSVHAGDQDARGLGHLWHASGGGSTLSLSRLCTYPGCIFPFVFGSMGSGDAGGIFPLSFSHNCPSPEFEPESYIHKILSTRGPESDQNQETRYNRRPSSSGPP